MSYRLVITSQQIQEKYLNLSVDQEHYLRRVLRLQSGDKFIALNGEGDCWLVELTKDEAIIMQSLQESNEISRSIQLLVALPKGSGFEDIVRSCTELGVSSFIPILSKRTLLVPSPAKVERWRRIAQEASEQSERQIVPKITNPTDLATALSQIDLAQMTSYLCVTRRGDAKHLAHSLLSSSASKGILLAIGPEGGWTEQEIEQCLTCGFQLVSLGNRILRTITAPLVAVAMVAAMLKE